MTNINKALEDAYNKLEKDYGDNFLGIFLFGSQNYKVDTPSSDLDFKAIVIPTVENMIKGNIKINDTIKMNFGEITVFDIKSLHDNIKKTKYKFS